MHQAEVPIVARHLCLNTYSSFDDTMICAGFYQQGGVDTCQVRYHLKLCVCGDFNISTSMMYN